MPHPDSVNRRVASDSSSCPHDAPLIEQQLATLMSGLETKLFDRLQKHQDSIVQRLATVIQESLRTSPSSFVTGRIAPTTSKAQMTPLHSQDVTSASLEADAAASKDVHGAADGHAVCSALTNSHEVDWIQKTHEKIGRREREFCEAIGWADTRSYSEVVVQPPLPQASLVGFEPEIALQMPLVRFVHSNCFQFATAAIVLANSTMIGVALDQDIDRALRGQQPLPWESTSDIFFTVAFAAELLLRFLAEGRHFFRGPGKWWNNFDLLVVVTGVLELVDIIQFSLTYLRVLRVAKVMRVFRVIRVLRFFRELRMMALSIISCLVSVVWAFVFLFMVMYVFALVLLEGARDHLRPTDGEEVDPEVKATVEKWFCGIWVCLFSLTQAVSGGNSWGDLARPLVKISWTYAAAFTLFITFVVFGLLNVLVGVFVSNTEQIADLDREFVIREEMDRHSSVMNQIRDLFLKMDHHHSGTLSSKQLRKCLDDPAVKGYFELVQIEVGEAEGLFKLLDVDESGEVGIEEFIVGCMRLKGTAKSIDVATLLYENKRMYQLLNLFMSDVREQFEDIKSCTMHGLRGPNVVRGTRTA